MVKPNIRDIPEIFLRILPCVFFISGCAHNELTHFDKKFIKMMQITTKHMEAQGEKLPSGNIEFKLWQKTPEAVVDEEIKSRKYRLASMAFGYHASEKDARLFGVACSAPVEVEQIVFGCVPPPAAYFKLLKRYNRLMIRQRDFPQRKHCSPDNNADKIIKEMDIVPDAKTIAEIDEFLENPEEMLKELKP